MFCVDTNFMIDLMKERSNAVELASEIKLSEVIITPITLYEVYIGELLVGKSLSEIRKMEKDFSAI